MDDPRRSRRHPVLLALTVLAFAALGAGVLYFANASRANRESATQWRRYAQRSDRLLAARTHQLNSRSKALNRTAFALAGSERDVKRLEARQRTLVDEKAQVEDQRGEMLVQTSQLETLAGEQRTCSDGLSRLLQEIADGDYAAADADAANVGDACDTARADFDAFESQYGGG